MSTDQDQPQLPPDWAFLKDLSPQELDHLLYGKKIIIILLYHLTIIILYSFYSNNI